MKITVGYTKTIRTPDHSYIPASDGFRAGADQLLVELDLDDAPSADPKVIAEHVWVATNAPYEMAGFERRVRNALRGYRAISVGDTVTVNGHTLACGKVGWEELHAGDLTTREVVIQSALIHPSWGIDDHAAFLESEHDVKVTDRLCKDIFGWMTQVAESNDLAGLHNFQLTESGAAKVAGHLKGRNAGRCGFENARGRCVADAEPSSPTGSCKLHEL